MQFEIRVSKYDIFAIHCVTLFFSRTLSFVPIIKVQFGNFVVCFIFICQSWDHFYGRAKIACNADNLMCVDSHNKMHTRWDLHAREWACYFVDLMIFLILFSCALWAQIVTAWLVVVNCHVPQVRKIEFMWRQDTLRSNKIQFLFLGIIAMHWWQCDVTNISFH